MSAIDFLFNPTVPQELQDFCVDNDALINNIISIGGATLKIKEDLGPWQDARTAELKGDLRYLYDVIGQDGQSVLTGYGHSFIQNSAGEWGAYMPSFQV